MTNNTDRAVFILAAYDVLPEPKDSLGTILMEVGDLVATDATPVHRLIHGLISSDDDFDDLCHEIDHALGECGDDDSDCVYHED